MHLQKKTSVVIDDEVAFCGVQRLVELACEKELLTARSLSKWILFALTVLVQILVACDTSSNALGFVVTARF